MSVPEPRSALSGALTPGTYGRPGGAEVTLRELHTGLVEIAARRGQEAALTATLQQHLGLSLPAPGRANEAGDAAALWIAPATAMIVAPPARLTALHDAIPSTVAAVLDQSSGFVALRLSGPMARATLAKGCRLDLDPGIFASGSVARSVIAQTSAIVHRLGGDAGFDVIVPATFARSFAEFLCHAAAEFGCTVASAVPRPATVL